MRRRQHRAGDGAPTTAPGRRRRADDSTGQATARRLFSFLAGVAGRGFTDRYWDRILPRLEPRTVIPTHYDDFFRPLGEPMGFTTNVNLAKVPEEVASVSRDFAVAALPPPVGLTPIVEGGRFWPNSGPS